MEHRNARAAVWVVALIAACSAADPCAAQDKTKEAAPAVKLDLAAVSRMAAARAAKPYRDTSPALPDSLAQLSYDGYRDIRFRPAAALWREQSLFEVQFFHRGAQFKSRVNLFEASAAGVRPLIYAPAQFDFGPHAPKPGKWPASMGYAGFRVHFPLHTPGYKDELIAFLGASYFKVLGRNQGYGLSARGLAVDTAGPGGEDFPRFTDFWLVRPQAQAQELVVYALLDSKSAVGAYRFGIRPGAVSQVRVDCMLYPRRHIDKLGVAPLTSMFLFGENESPRRFEDFRPEIHDSDGLLANNGAGEWLWRPLTNPQRLQVSRLLDENPRGFGLSQRDRNFDHYQDNEARGERRPSYWVEPQGQWGKGSVELVEIPTRDEINDNIVAYWVPALSIDPGKPYSFSYLLSAYLDSSRWPPGGKVIATRIGRVASDIYRKDIPDKLRRFVIDFSGGELDGLDPSQPVKATVNGRGVDIDSLTVERLGVGNVWRAAFRAVPKIGEPIDLRCYLTLYGQPLTETWIYLWEH